MPSVKDALKAVFQKNESKIQNLSKEFDDICNGIVDRQNNKAYIEADIKGGAFTPGVMRNGAIQNMRNIQVAIEGQFNAANEVLKKIERLGGKEQAADMRDKLNKLGEGGHIKGLKQEARGVGM